MTPTPFVVAGPAYWLVPALAAILVAGAVAIVVVRAARSRPVSGAEAFGFLLRASRIVALLLILSGGAGLLKVGFAQVFGDQFTYAGGADWWSGYVPVSCSGSAGASVSGSVYGNIRGALGPIATVAPASPAAGFGSTRIKVTPVPTPPLDTVQRIGPVPCAVHYPPARNLTGQKQSDAIRGAVLLLLGLAVAAPGLRVLSRVEAGLGAAATALRRLETLVGVVLFGLLAVGSVAAALPRALDIWLKVSDGQVEAPGAMLAVGILAVAPLAWYAVSARDDYVGRAPRSKELP